MGLHTECVISEQPQEPRGVKCERLPLGLTALESVLYLGGREWIFFSTSRIRVIELPKDLIWYKSKFNHHLNSSISVQPSGCMLWTKAANRHQEFPRGVGGGAYSLRCLQKNLNIIDSLMIASTEQSDLADNWNHDGLQPVLCCELSVQIKSGVYSFSFMKFCDCY